MIYPFAETLLVCLKDMRKSKAILVKGINVYFLATGYIFISITGAVKMLFRCSLPKAMSLGVKFSGKAETEVAKLAMSIFRSEILREKGEGTENVKVI